MLRVLLWVRVDSRRIRQLDQRAMALSHLLPEHWVGPNTQRVHQPIGRDAAVHDCAGDATEDAVPPIRLNHDCGSVCLQIDSCRLVQRYQHEGGWCVRHQTVVVYRTRGRSATVTAARAQLGKNRGTGVEFLGTRLQLRARPSDICLGDRSDETRSAGRGGL